MTDPISLSETESSPGLGGSPSLSAMGSSGDYIDPRLAELFAVRPMLGPDPAWAPARRLPSYLQMVLGGLFVGLFTAAAPAMLLMLLVDARGPLPEFEGAARSVAAWFIASGVLGAAIRWVVARHQRSPDPGSRVLISSQVAQSALVGSLCASALVKPGELSPSWAAAAGIVAAGVTILNERWIYRSWRRGR